MQYQIGNKQSWIYFSSDDNVNWMIDDIYVNTQKRYSGEGKKLVNAAIRKMRALGGKRVGLWSPVSETFDFWRKLGFNEQGIRKL